MNHARKVEAVLVDLGGVVIEIDFERALEHWQPMSRLSARELRQRFSMDHPYEQHERGEIPRREYFAHLREMLQLEGSDEELTRGWNAIFVAPLHDAVECIARVKGRVPVFALSNSNPTHQDAWMSAFPEVVAVFDGVFVSSDLGARKPEAAAFRAVAEATGISLPETLFFDDTLENVEGARAAGLMPVHVRTPADVRQALSAAGLI